jgi:hypothetical protein
MLHVYVLTDETGSWPLVTSHELPWRGLRTPPLTLLPHGEFDLLDDALACAADFGAGTRQGLVDEALDVQRNDRFTLGLEFPDGEHPA